VVRLGPHALITAAANNTASFTRLKIAQVERAQSSGRPRPLWRSCYEVAVFTGIVAGTGRVLSQRKTSSGARLAVEAALGALATGESISVNGACLTALAPSPAGFEADLSVETLEKTTLGGLTTGALVNLERSLTLADRLGGHWVTGHVDGIARVAALASVGDATRVELECQAGLLRYVAKKGSVALDGVSLTVNDVSSSAFTVMLIPHTLAVTTLAELAPGSLLNLEVDVLMRYEARWLEGAPPAELPGR
jgi:riboflavin synthase